MASRYYVNNQAQNTGEREVHSAECTHLPSNKTDLGSHLSCHSAVTAARRYYSNVDGCYYCCRPCHTR
ncbi:hypothetical protein [Aliiglaciecola aliphaticivorans]